MPAEAGEKRFRPGTHGGGRLAASRDPSESYFRPPKWVPYSVFTSQVNYYKATPIAKDSHKSYRCGNEPFVFLGRSDGEIVFGGGASEVHLGVAH